MPLIQPVNNKTVCKLSYLFWTKGLILSLRISSRHVMYLIPSTGLKTFSNSLFLVTQRSITSSSPFQTAIWWDCAPNRSEHRYSAVAWVKSLGARHSRLAGSPPSLHLSGSVQKQQKQGGYAFQCNFESHPCHYAVSPFNCSGWKGFSIMKQVKTDWRCRLSNEVLHHLMWIKHEGPKNYDPTKAINRWWLAKGWANQILNHMVPILILIVTDINRPNGSDWFKYDDSPCLSYPNHLKTYRHL